jgi:excisionase family DNA binding protein
MNEPDEVEDDHSNDVRYDLKSAKEAADYLRISESTVWRYVDQNIVPAYRVGKKRVWFKRSDLDALLKPLRGREGKVTKESKTLNLGSIETSARGGWAAMDRVSALRESITARRGGVAFSDSAEEINAARELRSQEQ